MFSVVQLTLFAERTCCWSQSVCGGPQARSVFVCVFSVVKFRAVVWGKTHLRPSGTREHKTRGKRSRSGTGIHSRTGQKTRKEHGKVRHNESRQHKHLLHKKQNESSEAVMWPREHVVNQVEGKSTDDGSVSLQARQWNEKQPGTNMRHMKGSLRVGTTSRRLTKDENITNEGIERNEFVLLENRWKSLKIT